MSQQQRHGSRSSTRSAFDQAQAQEMIRSLRVAELQQLLQELGLSKVGRKAELIERAIGTVTGKKMTTAQFQRLQQLHETRQGGGYGAALRSGPSASRSDMAADQVAGNSGYTSMPTLNNFFSTPSSILSPKNQLLPRFSESAAGASSSSWNGKEWAPAPALPAVPQMEELSSIRFPSLPFFDEMHCLIPPTNLNPINQSSSVRSLDGVKSVMQELSRTFTLTLEQANGLSMNRKVLPAAMSLSDGGYDSMSPKVEFSKQLLLRFALSCPSTGSISAVIDDCLPPSLCLRVNGKLCTLPPALPGKGGPKEGHRSSRPVDITPLTKLTPVVANMISITWHQPCLPYNSSIMDYSKRFVFTLVMVSKLSPEELVAKVRSKGTKSAEFTISIIRDKLRDEDAEIATTSLRASLLCPLAKMRIRNPARSTTCTHIQCFDIQFFLQMNEKKPTWICPVCDSRIKFSDLVVDGLFTDILASDRSSEKTEVQFDEINGQIEWSPIVKVDNKSKSTVVPTAGPTPSKRKSDEESAAPPARKKKPTHEIITLDDSDEENGSDPVAGGSGNCSAGASSTSVARPNSWSNRQTALIELSLSDDDDDEQAVMDFTMSCRSRSDAAANAIANSSDSSDSDFVADQLAAFASDFAAAASAYAPFFNNNSNQTHSTSAGGGDDEDDDDIAIIE